MKRLTHSVRIRFSNDDMVLFKELKQLKKKPTTFIRDAFRGKVSVELPKLIEAEKKRQSENYCPF